METDNIRYTGVRSAVITADNSMAGEERPYDVSAELSFKGAELSSIGNGRVADRAAGVTLASFGESGDGSLWLNLHVPGDDGQAVLAAIRGFTAACRAKASAEPPSVA